MNRDIVLAALLVATSFDEFKTAFIAAEDERRKAAEVTAEQMRLEAEIAEAEKQKADEIAAFEKQMADQIAAAEKQKADEVAAEFARIESEKQSVIDAFDPSNVSVDMVQVLKITNGMPEWLILQRYTDWVNSHA